MTLSQILVAVKSNIGGRDDKDTEARTGVNLSIEELVKQEDFSLATMIYEQNVNPEDGFIALPSRFVKIQEVRLINGLQSYKLLLKDKNRVLRDYPNTDALSSSYPLFCYTDGEQLFLAPRCALTCSIRLTYNLVPSFDNDDSEISPYIPGLDKYLIAYSTYWTFLSMTMINPATMWERVAATALQSAINLNRRVPGEDVRRENVQTVPTYYNDPNDPFNFANTSHREGDLMYGF